MALSKVALKINFNKINNHNCISTMYAHTMSMIWWKLWIYSTYIKHYPEHTQRLYNDKNIYVTYIWNWCNIHGKSTSFHPPWCYIYIFFYHPCNTFDAHATLMRRLTCTNWSVCEGLLIQPGPRSSHSWARTLRTITFWW